MAMDHTLNVYNNLQYNPIQIGDFCVVEVYKDEISLVNQLGYFIQPLDGVEDVKETITKRVREKHTAEGYDTLVILSGRKFDSYNRRIVYAIWCDPNAIPQYPEEPEQYEIGEVGDEFDHYQNLTINNEGAPTYCSITLTLDKLDLPIDFYLNDDFFSIDLSDQIPSDEMVLTIDRTGISYNGKPIDSYNYLSVPKLLFGVNYLSISRLMVKKVKVEFTRKF